MDWLIYPVTKNVIKITAAVFGLSTVIIWSSLLGLPVLTSTIHPNISAIHKLVTLLIAQPALIISLSILCNWCSQVLLSCRGNHVVRVFGVLLFIPSFIAACAPFSALPPAALDEALFILMNIFFMFVATMAFFAYPFTAGYRPRDRKLFLCWAVTIALFGISELIVNGLHTLAQSSTVLHAIAAVLFSGAVLVALPVLSVILAWRLYKNVSFIASLPEKATPQFRNKEEEEN